jgi:hypothetical protein
VGGDTSGDPTTGGNPGTSGGGTTGGNPTGGGSTDGNPTSGDPPSDITVLAPISWSGPTVLELGASDTIDIQAPITVGGGGGLVLGDASDASLQPATIKIGANISFTGAAVGGSSVLTLNPASGGDSSLYDHAVVTFADTSYAFSAGGVSFTLIGDIATLASDLGTNPAGHYALAKDIDASGASYSAPLAADFTGVLEGFNHSVDGLTIDDSSSSHVGLFGITDANSSVQDLDLTHLSVTAGAPSAMVGGVAGYNDGSLGRISVAGSVTGGASSSVGALVGLNDANVSAVSVNALVTTGANGIAGGVVGANSGSLQYSFSAGAVLGGDGAAVGGLIGSNGATTTQSVSTAFVHGGAGSTVGGFVGSDAGAVSLSYYDADTAGTTLGVGSEAGTPDLTRLSTASLQSALPSGLDTSVWAIDAGKSYPYLISDFSGVPLVVSGVAYSDFGSTRLGSSSSGRVGVNVLLDGADVGDLIAGASGYYYLTLQPGALSGGRQLLTYLTGGELKANTYVQDAAADVTNADLYGGAVRILSGAGAVSDMLAGLSTAIGSKSGGDFLFASGQVRADTSLDIESSRAGGLAIDHALDSGVGSIVINANGAVSQTAPLSGAGLELLGSNASYSLTAGNAIGTLAANTGAVALTSTGDLTVGAVNGAMGVTSSAGVTLRGPNLIVASGAKVTAGAGDDVVLAATGDFTNDEGSDAVQVSGGGRWLIYSNAPGGDAFGSLDSGHTAIWHSTESTYAPGSVTEAGNRYLFAFQPTLTVTTTNVSKEYGADASSSVAAAYSIGGLQAGVTGAYLGDSAGSVHSGTPSVTSTGSGVTASVADGPYAITGAAGSLSVGDNYALSFANTGTLSVDARPITVTANNLSREYGASNPALTYTLGGDGFVNGDGLSGSLATTAATASNVGGYGITQGSLAASSDYKITFTAGTLTVTARPITVTANNLSREYGAANPALTYTVGGDGLVNGDGLSGSLATAATTTSNVGGYSITQGALAASGNYHITSFTGATLTITARPITITANNFSREYGASNPSLTYAVGGDGLVNGDGLSGSLATTAVGASNVGGYGITQGSLAASGNYHVTSFTPGTLTITARPITVTADNLSREYGDANPTLTYAVGGDGLVNGDSLSGNLATAAAKTSHVGGYGITQGTLAASGNYRIRFTAGTLTITARSITVTAENLSREYGNANPALAFTVGGDGLVNGDTLDGSLATTASAASNVGGYGITQGTLGASGDYHITSFTPGTLTITARPITITAQNLSRNYGDANPTLTFAVGGDGLANGDSLSGSLATTAGATSNVGGYGITQSSLAASSNYDVTSFTAGTLTVTARPIAVTADNLSREYGNANPTLTYAVGGKGLVNGDSLTGGLATAASAASNIGGYGITQGTLAASGNYDLSFTPGTLTVTARPITVTADNLSREYGGANPALTFTVGGDGLVNGDSLSGSLATAAAGASNVGGYGITQGTLAASANYDITRFTPGTLTITARPITVTADDLSRYFGAANPTLTYAVGGDGLVNGDSLTGGLATDATVDSAAGGYGISQGSLAASSNYDLKFVGGTLTVLPAVTSTTPGVADSLDLLDEVDMPGSGTPPAGSLGDSGPDPLPGAKDPVCLVGGGASDCSPAP